MWQVPRVGRQGTALETHSIVVPTLPHTGLIYIRYPPTPLGSKVVSACPDKSCSRPRLSIFFLFFVFYFQNSRCVLTLPVRLVSKSRVVLHNLALTRTCREPHHTLQRNNTRHPETPRARGRPRMSRRNRSTTHPCTHNHTTAQPPRTRPPPPPRTPRPPPRPPPNPTPHPPTHSTHSWPLC